MSGTALAIPADDIVSINPQVLPAGGTALDLIAVMITDDPRHPLGSVPKFSNANDVATYYGAQSTAALLASTYFLGFDNSNVKPGALRFAGYNAGSVGAWLRGGSLAGVALSTLQAITSGTVIVNIDGSVRTSSSINLSSATSFSAAAELISVALGGAVAAGASFTAAIVDGLMTVSAVASGTIKVGQEVRGSNTAAGTLVASPGTGTGGTGTYNVVPNGQTVSSAALTTVVPTVTWDTISSAFVISSSTTGASSTIAYATGTLADALGLSAATGAVLSQGAVAQTPAGMMDSIAAQTRDWATFMTTFNPDNSGHANRVAFAAWSNGKNDRFVYIPWDNDITPTQSTNASGCLGQALLAANYSGYALDYSPAQGATIAAFTCGAIASIDFSEEDGRTNMNFRGQTGITPDVTNQTAKNNLIANGYNCYGVWATANQRFQFFTPGICGGPFKWLDSFLNQIWMNSQFQLALMVLLTVRKSVPYNEFGRTLLRAALKDPINQAENFGSFVAGVVLSEAQAAEVNAAAGVKIDQTLTAQGWYLQIKDASPQVRKDRGTPPMSFWYTDGESVNQINLASINVQ